MMRSIAALALMLALVVVASAQSGHQEVRCNFETVNGLYTCTIRHANITSETIALTFPDQHVAGMTRESVQAIRTHHQFWTRVHVLHPQLLSQFPNTRRFVLMLAHLERFATNSFEHCANVEEIVLANNQLRSIPNAIFAACRSLRALDLSSNWLTALSDEVFVGIEQLEDFRLRHTAVTVTAATFSRLTSLRRLWLADSRISDPAALRHLVLLRDIALERVMVSFDFALQLLDGLDELATIDLAFNNFTDVDLRAFARFPNLESLRLDGNSIGVIPAGSAVNLNRLRILQLQQNRIASIATGTFAGLTSLEQLWLGNNQLEVIQADTFAAMPAILIIMLNNNRITTLHSNAFRGLASLFLLDLGNNQIAFHAPVVPFVQLPALFSLRLHRNSIDGLPPLLFAALRNLTDLNLAHNAIVRLNSDSFQQLSALATLSVASNRVDEIQRDFFAHFPVLRTFDAVGNECVNASVDFRLVVDMDASFGECFANWDTPRTTPEVVTTTTTEGAVETTTPTTTSTTDGGAGVAVSVALIAAGFLVVLRAF